MTMEDEKCFREMQSKVILKTCRHYAAARVDAPGRNALECGHGKVQADVRASRSADCV